MVLQCPASPTNVNFRTRSFACLQFFQLCFLSTALWLILCFISCAHHNRGFQIILKGIVLLVFKFGFKQRESLGALPLLPDVALLLCLSCTTCCFLAIPDGLDACSKSNRDLALLLLLAVRAFTNSAFRVWAFHCDYSTTHTALCIRNVSNAWSAVSHFPKRA